MCSLPTRPLERRAWTNYEYQTLSLSIECPSSNSFLACALCLNKNLNASRLSERPPVWGGKCQNVYCTGRWDQRQQRRQPFIFVIFCLFIEEKSEFLFCVFVSFSCSRWSFADVPLIFSGLATTDTVLLEARSVNVKHNNNNNYVQLALVQLYIMWYYCTS